MKFRFLFIVLNIVLFSAFLAVFFLPYTLVSRDYFVRFWMDNWFLVVIFLGTVGFVTTIFIRNWSILTYLEREDWPALAEHLEKQIFYRKKTGKRYVRLLFESLVLLGDFATIDKLSSFLRTENPKRYRDMSRGIAGATVLAGNYRQTRVFSTEFLERKDLSVSKAHWLRFYRGLACSLDEDPSGAVQDFFPLAGEAPEPLVAVLSTFLCDAQLRKHGDGIFTVPRDTIEDVISRRKQTVLRKYTERTWDRYIQAEGRNLEVAILGNLPQQATAWLYSR